jgi:UDP-N-acetylmuramoyl-L-alanyl-D-glutamate--2,6-diaminopimelate ligase
MEVSSHALALDRVAGLTYDCAIWTNLTQDHLDFHKTMEDYYQAKKLLFTGYIKKGGRAVINIDDPWGKRLAGELPHIEIATYGWSEGARVRIVEGVSSPNGTDITLQTEAGRLHFSSKLSGHFNIYNMTALVTGALSLSINVKVIERCFQTMETVPGRMERVPLSAGYSVFVDYAHTPDALVNVLSTARNFTQGRLVCVFGCGGDRDKTKRPLMAEAVTQHCDEAIITSDNPRGENPLSIMRDIVQGIPLDFPHVTIADRREAIRKAIREARPGDCIIVAGKGHEDYQEIKGVRRHFDDRETVVELFAELERSHA